MGKRAATKVLSESQIKKAKVAAVQEVLRDESLESQVPPVARRILAKCADDALAGFREERHEVQTTVGGFIKQVFDDIRASKNSKIQETAGTLESRTVSVPECEAKLASANEAVEKAGARVDEETTAHQAAAGAEEVASKALAQERALDAAQEKEDRKVETEAQKTRTFQRDVLHAAECKAAAAKKIVAELGRYGADHALLASLPHAYAAGPERAGFDLRVVQAADALVAARLQGFEEARAVIAAERARLAGGIGEREQAHEQARTVLLAQSEKLEAARGDATARRAEQAEASNALDECKRDVDRLTKARAAEDRDLSAFQEVFASVAELEASARPPPPEPEEAGEAGEATAAPEQVAA